MTGTRQMITVTIAFRKSNETHWSFGLAPVGQVRKKTPYT